MELKDTGESVEATCCSDTERKFTKGDAICKYCNTHKKSIKHKCKNCGA